MKIQGDTCSPFSQGWSRGALLFAQAFSSVTSSTLGGGGRGVQPAHLGAAAGAGGKAGWPRTAGRAAAAKGQVTGEGRGAYLVHSIRDDGGQSDSICPLKAFSVGATYFPFTVSSSSSRRGCWKKHKPVTRPELPGGRFPDAPP